MTTPLSEARAWLEAHYQEAGLALPDFRWVRREAPGTGAEAPGDALLVADAEVRLLLLVLDLAGLTAPEALAAQVQADLQAAWALRSACRPGSGPGLPGADRAWRVAVHWLGGDGQEAAWRAAVLHTRQVGAILDEIAVNAGFRGADQPLAECLDRGGFPGLLLAARQAFRRNAPAMDLWVSADRRVRAVLAGLPGALAEPRAQAIAQELQALADQEPAPGAGLPSGPPRSLGRLRVTDVRGVRDLALEPWPGGGGAQAWVLAGPNGSGKSSLAEAVSLRAFGSSRGLCAYLRDPDVTRARTAQGYLAQYSTPVGGGTPQCALDGGPGTLALAPDLEAALEALAAADGTVAAQGGATGFLELPGDLLGARMARSFSALAVRLEAHVEAGRRAAGEVRTALARRHGISPAVRKLETFREKIAHAALEAARVRLPPECADFLACRAALPGPDGHSAAALRQAWAEAAGSDALAAALLKARPAPETTPDQLLTPWFADQERRCRDLADQLAAFRAKVATLPAAPLGLAGQASQWADWLSRPREPEPAPAPASGQLEALLAERAGIAERGRRARPLHDHLAQALAFIRAHWLDHPLDCPTCGSHLPGPVAGTAAALLAEAEAELGRQREAYAALTRRIQELEGRAPAGAAQGCPVSLEIRRQIQDAVTALVDPGLAAEDLLRGDATRPALEQLLSHAEAPPEAAFQIPAASACAAAIRSGWREAAAALEEPEAWEQVARELTRRLAEAVAGHLPATLEALWRELAACLSPAPWLLPAPPRFQPRTVRGANRVEVVLEPADGEPRLARHLLNDAQVRTLGLAWTFCQHLVRARFHHAWMLLDDPAQDMDQPAYRAFCRFLATLLGLYRAAGRPFTLLLLLNHEERAMDAARETGQGLIVLGWTGSQETAATRRIALFAEGTRSPQPDDLWGRSAG